MMETKRRMEMQMKGEGMAATSCLYGGIEAGGTKFVCAVGETPQAIRASTSIPTTTPTATLNQVIAFFQSYPIHHLGLAAFGPIDPDRDSPTYGHILSTPKLAWQGCPIVHILQTALKVPVAFDTDVNAAAIAEATYGAGRGDDPLVYLTVGTGIGGGAMIHGRPLHGLMHPEMGHMLQARVLGDTRPSGCPFHEDCLEGLASGHAIQLRFGTPAGLPPQHEAWMLEATYLGQALATIVTILSPQRIIIGGGVMHQPFLLPRIREVCARTLHGYLPRLKTPHDFESYIVAPVLGDNAGVIGALLLAQEACSPSFTRDTVRENPPSPFARGCNLT
jgi:fructokinase